jgi:phosphoribosylaminoimidazole-succinocarboxamide synthase
MREQLIREVEIIPLEVVVRNVAAGSLSTQASASTEGQRLPRSIIEYYYKNDALNDPMVARRSTSPAFGWAATPQEIDDIVALTLRVNDFLTGLFLGVGITSRRLQAGVRPAVGEATMMRIVVADEISPDSIAACGMRRPVERQDGQGPLPPRPGRPGRGLGYQEVARRLGILPEAGPRDMTGPELMQ